MPECLPLLLSFVSCSLHVFQKMANNSSISNNTRCGGLNPSFHHCYKSEINSFESALTSILIVEFCIVIFGVVGNTFLFFLMRRPRFVPQAFAVYFMFSAVSDSLNLIINLASDVAGSTNTSDFSTMAAKQGTCGLFFMLTSVTGIASPWLIVLLTLDRFISTCFPQKYSAIVNRRRGIIMASGLLLLAVVVNIPFATSYKTYTDFDEDTNSTSYSCELTMFSEPLMGELLSIIIGNIIPLGLILVLSLMMCCALRRSGKFRSPKCCQWNRSSVLIFYVAVMIFLTWLPGNIVEFVETSYAIRGIDSPLVDMVVDKSWHACLMLYLFSFSQNFYILMLISPMYRSEATKMLGLKRDAADAEADFELDSDDDSKPMLKDVGNADQTNSITL